jgi:hypothetical protein
MTIKWAEAGSNDFEQLPDEMLNATVEERRAAWQARRTRRLRVVALIARLEDNTATIAEAREALAIILRHLALEKK